MTPINRRKFEELRRRRLASCTQFKFVDEYKIALHLEPVVLQMPDQYDIVHGLKRGDLPQVDVRTAPLRRSTAYLGFSVERICIPNNVIGSLHTRSALSRLGLDFFGSSTYVSPGFGSEQPTQIVFEIAARIDISHLPLEEHVAGLVLYQIEGVHEIWKGAGKHRTRFPFSDLEPGSIK